jgi:pimeloyl-ACP methyl ester carboxylesterase
VNHTVLEPQQRRSGSVPVTVQQHIDDHVAALPPGITLVGWSWGAMLALSYTAQHPHRVAKLVLVGCGTYDEAGRIAYRQAMTERMGTLQRAELESLQRRFGEVGPDGRNRIIESIGRLSNRAQAVDEYPESPCPDAGSALDPLTETPPDALGYEQTWKDVLARQRAGTEPASFAAIECPVLMTHGAGDPHPGRVTRDLLRHRLPHLEYLEFNRCGHRPWLERAAVDHFLAAVGAWTCGASPARPGENRTAVGTATDTQSVTQ